MCCTVGMNVYFFDIKRSKFYTFLSTLCRNTESFYTLSVMSCTSIFRRSARREIWLMHLLVRFVVVGRKRKRRWRWCICLGVVSSVGTVLKVRVGVVCTAVAMMRLVSCSTVLVYMFHWTSLFITYKYITATISCT